MSSPLYRIWTLLFLGGFVGPGMRHVSGISIYTPKELEVVNGTSVRLKCTFTSTDTVSLQSVIVFWSFRPLNSPKEESLFYYQEVPYPPTNDHFKNRVVWSGNVLKQDASITLNDVTPSFNGTYICQVRNRPDVHGSNGEIILRVVSEVSLSEISILAAAVGGACLLILVLLGIFVAVRYCRRKGTEDDFALQPREHRRNDSTMCSPEEAVHLTITEKKKEVSSDDEESEPSSGDDDEEEDSEDGDDDDDDDDDGGDDDDDD